MLAASSAEPTVLKCQGVIIHHRKAWWLVEFPNQKAKPTRAIRLSGRFSPKFAEVLRGLSGDPRLPNEIDTLCWWGPCKRSGWWGTVSLIPAARGKDRFDIDGHPWRETCSYALLKQAMTMIDTTLYAIPARFTSVFDSLPADDVPVLALRVSKSPCAKFELLTAFYRSTDHPFYGWRDIDGKSLIADDDSILAWKPVRDWIKPSRCWSR